MDYESGQTSVIDRRVVSLIRAGNELRHRLAAERKRQSISRNDVNVRAVEPAET